LIIRCCGLPAAGAQNDRADQNQTNNQGASVVHFFSNVFLLLSLLRLFINPFGTIRSITFPSSSFMFTFLHRLPPRWIQQATKKAFRSRKALYVFILHMPDSP